MVGVKNKTSCNIGGHAVRVMGARAPANERASDASPAEHGDRDNKTASARVQPSQSPHALAAPGSNETVEARLAAGVRSGAGRGHVLQVRARQPRGSTS